MTRYSLTRNAAAAAAVMAALGMAAPAVAAPALHNVQAKLKSVLNTAHAKVGETITAVTTSNLKEGGRVVLPRGSLLTGRVTRADAAPNKKADSKLGLVFRRAVTPKGARINLRGGIDFLTAARDQTAQLPHELSFSPLRAGGYLISAKGNFRIARGMIAQVAITQTPMAAGT